MNRNIPNGTLRESGNHALRLLPLSGLMLALSALRLSEKILGVGSWTGVATGPGDNIGRCTLLSKGSVLAEGSGGRAADDDLELQDAESEPPSHRPDGAGFSGGVRLERRG